MGKFVPPVSAHQPRTLEIPLLRRSIGLGDVVKTLTQVVGIPSCHSCERRRKQFNRYLRFAPHKKTPK